MKAYWWNGVPNFGDRMAPLLLQHYAGIHARWAPLDDSDVVVTGSVLHHIRPNWSGKVVGAGKIRADIPVKLKAANLLAVRGPLSARGLPGDFALGDPGLLADEMVTIDTREYDLGILPHWSDTDLAYRAEFLRYNPRIIDSRNDPLEVVREIGKCNKLVTSSLHGMIVADAFGIPRRVETTPLFDLDTHFKFQDYSASIGFPFTLGVTQKAPRGYVEARKHELYDVFEELRHA